MEFVLRKLLPWIPRDYDLTVYFSFFGGQAFDQQQQDLVDAASKALSYRQDIIEENIRLTYALQVTFSRLKLLYHIFINSDSH